MEKIILLLILTIAIVLTSISKQPEQYEIAKKYTKPTTPKDLNAISERNAPESKADQESLTTKKADESRPGILFMLSNDKGLPGWSPSLWWIYQHASAGQTGC